MSKNKFVWDADDLIPSEVTIKFPPIKDGKPDYTAPAEKQEEVTFYELPNLKLLQFVTESENMVIYQPSPEDTPTERKGKYRPVQDVGREHSDFLNKWLSISCRGARSPEWFEQQELGVSAVIKLCDMISQINHVIEIMASQGNWFMLPLMQTAEEASEPLPLTPQA
jgi:hypothetical protein